MIATADGGVIAQGYVLDLDDWSASCSGPTVTFDQNGNATGQMANLPTYSWLGNAYQDGPLDQVLAMMPDFALCFAAFQGGSPSSNGTYVKFVPSKMFLPVEISTIAAVNATFYDQVKRNMDPTKVSLSILKNQKAAAAAFQDALAKTNMIVEYLGHGFMIAGASGAAGLCFGEKETQCLTPKALWPGLPEGATDVDIGGGRSAHVLENGFAPEARIVFIGHCFIDDKYLAQWHIKEGHALIVPQYLTPDEFNHFDLYYAGWEVQGMLLKLALGGTVDEAIAVGNEGAANQGVNHRWRLANQGGGSVKIR
jgi:hypothetical protein